MSLFKNYSKDSESIFKNEIALDPSFTPRGKIEFRENENQYIADCIKPLLHRRNGKNLIIFGPPGIGKTLACKKVKEALEEETNEISVFYINLWKKNTQHKITLELCEQLDYKFTHNKSSEELLRIVKQKINQNSAVFIFDEADKAESLELLYQLTEDIYRKTIIMITNDKNWIYKLDPRLKSRIMPDSLEFRPYKKDEIKSILKSRVQLAFNQSIIEQKAMELIIDKTEEATDIRIGLFLLRESAFIAESSSSKQIKNEHVEKAISKLADFKKPIELDKDEEKIMEIVDKNPNKTTNEIFMIYQNADEQNKSQRTFLRKINNLEKANLIKLEEVQGIQGRSYKVKKLSEF
ncbi:AAA family ATPase [Candidatus Woesearchaeota archaeon]|nr:AAA family ATPase [Candidatus Woesearchaeota archaeon]